MTTHEEFQLEQYKTLRSEIATNIEEIRSLQRYALIALALVWTWIGTHFDVAPAWAMFTPLAFVVLGCVHTWRVLHEMSDQGIFIATVIEPVLCGTNDPAEKGWENWLRRVPRKDRVYPALPKRQLTAEEIQKEGNHNPAWWLAPVWLVWYVLTALIVGMGTWAATHHSLLAASKPHGA